MLCAFPLLSMSALCCPAGHCIQSDTRTVALSKVTLYVILCRRVIKLTNHINVLDNIACVRFIIEMLKPITNNQTNTEPIILHIQRHLTRMTATAMVSSLQHPLTFSCPYATRTPVHAYVAIPFSSP